MADRLHVRYVRSALRGIYPPAVANWRTPGDNSFVPPTNLDATQRANANPFRFFIEEIINQLKIIC